MNLFFQRNRASHEALIINQRLNGNLAGEETDMGDLCKRAQCISGCGGSCSLDSEKSEKLKIKKFA